MSEINLKKNYSILYISYFIIRKFIKNYKKIFLYEINDIF